MFTLEKFSHLDEKVRLRHMWRWLKEAEVILAGGSLPDLLMKQLEILGPWLASPQDGIWIDVAGLSRALAGPRAPGSLMFLGREMNRLHHEISALIGQEAAEWDLREGLWQGRQPPEGDGSPALPEAVADGIRGPKRASRRIYLDDLRSPFNVGSIFRTAEVFGFDEVILSPRCPALDHPRLERSAMGCVSRVSSRRMEFMELLESCDGGPEVQGIFALELGGTCLSSFHFPQNGIVVLGNEELGVNPEILGLCQSGSGRVTIPMKGSKASLNVAVSFGILAHAWAFA